MLRTLPGEKHINYKNWKLGKKVQGKCKIMNHRVFPGKESASPSQSEAMAKHEIKNINGNFGLLMVFIIVFLTLERTLRSIVFDGEEVQPFIHFPFSFLCLIK
jgi:hypothetical protein